MKKCKYCGKEFDSTPIYCVRCGASEDFLVRKTQNPKPNYTDEGSYHDYDELVKDFLGDDKKQSLGTEKVTFDDVDEPEDEYYASLKKKLGSESINSRVKKPKEDYYGELEDLFDEPLRSTEETTFNGIFDKEDTIENTFFRKKEKRGRGASHKPMKKDKNPSQKSRRSKEPVKEPTIEMTARTKKSKKTSKKLWKMVFGLVALLALLLVLMFTLIGHIVNVNDDEAPLPSETVALSLFSDIKAVDEASFLNNPNNLFISEDMDIFNSTNQDHLKALYDLVNAKDYEIKGVKKIEPKGAVGDTLRAQVTYDVTGDSLSAKVFETLIFRKETNGDYKLDFEEFILRYERLKNSNNTNNT